MSQKSNLKPLAIAMGAAFATSLAAIPAANAAENPFAMTDLSSGYMVADSHEAKCGEGKCGAAKSKERKCGMKMMDADEDGNITMDEFMEAHEAKFKMKDKNNDGMIDADEMKAREGKCGEGKCGEGKCGGAKAKEAKCGEGKCGGDKAKEAKCGEGKCGGDK